MDKNETFRRDTIDECVAYLHEVLKTIDVEAELRQIIIVPMRRNGKILGYETIVRWIDRSPEWR